MAVLAAAPWILVALCASVEFLASDAKQRSASEQDVKAAFLYNFTRFVTWPAGIPPAAEPFRLCVIADGETTAAITRTMQGESVDGRPVLASMPGTVEEARACQVLFVGRGALDRAMPLLDGVREQPVLTVGDEQGFVHGGGAIEFVLEQGRVRFDINRRSAERTGLKLSSRLLKVARHVVDER